MTWLTPSIAESPPMLDLLDIREENKAQIFGGQMLKEILQRWLVACRDPSHPARSEASDMGRGVAKRASLSWLYGNAPLDSMQNPSGRFVLLEQST